MKFNQNLKEALEVEVEGLQPGALEGHVCQGLPLPAEGGGDWGVGEVHHIHAHGDDSREEPPAEVPSGSWDEGGVQAQPLGCPSHALAKQVLPLCVWVGHKCGMMDHAAYEHVEVATMDGGKVDQSGVMVEAPVP